MMVTLKEAKKYYRKGTSPIDRVVKRDLMGDDEIVVGGKAVNKQLPRFLRRSTEDWDIVTPDDPEEVAEELEEKLDKEYGGDFFYSEPASHAGTQKIRSHVTEKGVVDITEIVGPVDHKTINGINYATLDYQKGKIQESLSDPESSFRHKKDLEILQRIGIAEGQASLTLGLLFGEAEPAHSKDIFGIASRKETRGDPFGMNKTVFPGVNSSRGR